MYVRRVRVPGGSKFHLAPGTIYFKDYFNILCYRGKLAEEKGEEKMEAEEEGKDLWGKLVELTQTAFREGEMAEEATW